jgi:hypothetical protein
MISTRKPAAAMTHLRRNPERERPEPELACQLTDGSFAKGSERALSNGRHVVGNRYRGSGPQRLGDVLPRAARLAHRSRGARNGDSRRSPGSIYIVFQ